MNRKSNSIGFGLALFFWLMISGAAYGQQPALVIEGGTLIDGNGGTPVPDTLIIIQGDRIATVGRKGQPYPANAQVIKADGKFIVPGLWDAHAYGTWYLNDFYLNHGITSIGDSGLGGELGRLHREAVNRGKIPGPRYVMPIGSLSGVPRFNTTYPPLGFYNRQPKTPEEAREIVRQYVDAKADLIFFHDAELPLDIIAAGADEAKKAGKPLALERVSKNLTLEKGIEMGFNFMTHSPGVAETIAKDPSKWRNELDLYADMDPAKAKALIDLLVSHKVTLVPNFLNIGPGYAKDWKRFEEEDKKLFSNPDILSWYPETTIFGRETALGLIREGVSRIPTGDPAVIARRRQGWMNVLRFHLDLLRAGGRVLTGGNTQSTRAAGLNLHHEMEAFVEGGFTTMETIQAATKWQAEAMHMQDRIGTIESGKLADMLVVSGDPLQDIRNLQKIDTLVFNGKVQDRSYHPWISDPFKDEGNEVTGNPAVESWDWVVTLKKASRGGGGEGGGEGEGEGGGGVRARGGPKTGLPDPSGSPQPAIEEISPRVVTEGSPTTTVTLKGFNFVRRMQVYFNGKSVPFKAASPTELQVTLDASLLRTPGKFDFVVKNPSPLATPDYGNGTSNIAHLLIDFKY